MYKDTPSHEIQLDFADESVISGRILVDQLTALAMLIKPQQFKTITHPTFSIQLFAKESYTPEAFFQEHQQLLDNLVKDIKEN